MNKIHPDSRILLLLVTNVLLILLAAGITAAFYIHLPPFIPLYNQLSWGLPRLTPKEFIVIPISIAICIGIANFILSRFMYEKMPIVSRILIVSSLFASILMLLLIIRTVQVVI